MVLAFFPAAFSGTCQTEMCKLRDSASALNKVSAKVLGISVDTFFALKAWADANKFNFPLLSDFNKEVIAKYGVVNPDMIGLKDIAKRSVFVIDKAASCVIAKCSKTRATSPITTRLPRRSPVCSCRGG